MSDTNTARDHLLGYCLAATTNEVTCAKAEELADAYRDEVLAKAAERLLPPWEAVYDSATFTPYLLAYCNDETAAKGAAEEWLRQHCADAAGLAWTPDPVMAGDEWEQWLTLTQTSGDGTVLATEIVVRRRAARTTTAQEDRPVTATEWVLTPQNVDELWNVIGHAKPHQSYPEGSRHLQVDGLTIWPHADRPRTWARFGDTIRRDSHGRYTVTSPTGEPR